MGMGSIAVDLPTSLLISTLVVSVAISCVVFCKQLRPMRRRAPLPPGPRGWPVLGNLPQLGGSKHHQTLHEMSKVYGPLLRQRFGSSDVVVARSAAVAELFLRRHDANFSSWLPNSGGEHMAYNFQDMVFATYGLQWRTKQKVCAVNLLCPRALDGFRAMRESEAVLMVRSLVAASATPVAVDEAVNVCTTNAMSLAAVGRQVFAATGDDDGAREFKEIMLEVMQVGGVLNVGDFVPVLRWLDDMMNRIIADKKAGVEKVKDRNLLSLLLAMVRDEPKAGGRDEYSVGGVSYC